MTKTVMWARQYSKRLITFLFVAWAIGAIIGIGYEFIRLKISPETATMDSLYIYLAVPLTCGVPSYLIPAALLNREKVRQNYIPNYDNTVLVGDYGEENNGNNQEIQEDFNVTGLHDYTETYPPQSRY